MLSMDVPSTGTFSLIYEQDQHNIKTMIVEPYQISATDGSYSIQPKNTLLQRVTKVNGSKDINLLIDGKPSTLILDGIEIETAPKNYFNKIYLRTDLAPDSVLIKTDATSLKIKVVKFDNFWSSIDLGATLVNKAVIEFNKKITLSEVRVGMSYILDDVSKYAKVHKNILTLSGDLAIKKSLVVNKDETLILLPATKLLFARDASLVVFGNLVVKGSEKNPVIFEGLKKEGFAGVLIFNSSRSVIDHAKFNGLNGGYMGPIYASGGLSVINSNIEITNSSFRNLYSNDGIHLAHSKYKIRNIDIDNTFSDAIDIDWGIGSIEESIFNRCGEISGSGDCLDLSDTTAYLKNIKTLKSTDKGISIGEHASAEIIGVDIKNSPIGIAVKDGSRANISNSNVHGIKYGLAAYRKKSYWGKPNYTIKNSNIHGGNADTIAPVGLQYSLD